MLNLCHQWQLAQYCISQVRSPDWFSGPGEDVFGESPGCLRRYNCGPAALLSPKPDSWSFEEVLKSAQSKHQPQWRFTWTLCRWVRSGDSTRKLLNFAGFSSQSTLILWKILGILEGRRADRLDLHLLSKRLTPKNKVGKVLGMWYGCRSMYLLHCGDRYIRSSPGLLYASDLCYGGRGEPSCPCSPLQKAVQYIYIYII